MIQSIHDDEVAGLYLFMGERQLHDVIFASMWIVLCAVGTLFKRVGHSFSPCNRVDLLFRQIVVSTTNAYHRFVYTLPVVYILALTPTTLEVGLTLVYRHGVIKVPLSLLLLVGSSVLVPIIAVGRIAIIGSILRYYLVGFLLLLLAAFLLFLLFQRLNHLIDGSITRFLVGASQLLKRVLQMHRVSIRHQFV